jgi:hypothetical protein
MSNKTTLLIVGGVLAVFVWLGLMRNNGGTNTTGSASQQPLFVPRTPPPLPGTQAATIQPPAPRPQASAQATIPSGALNPEHGKPGHRCDIPVGSPLNSAPANANASKQQVALQQPVSPAKTPAGINPPHGQPGHRCDIAVGAPLNSKPAPPAQTTVQQTQPVAPATAAKPVTAAQQALAQSTQAPSGTLLPAAPKGKNPAHGQPGHKCELPVGADLDSAARAKKQ